MATYGAMNAMWAPFTGTEPAASEKKPPTYGEAVSIGSLNQTDDKLSFAEASAYGDNGRKIYLRRFKDGTVDATSVDTDADTLSAIYGCSVDEKGSMAHGGADNAPYGGYGFLINRIDEDNKDYYQGIFYPKVKGGVNDSNTYATRGENITIALDKIHFSMNEANCGKYKVEGPRMDTEAEAMAWLSGLFTGTTKIPGLADAGETES